MSNPTNHIAAAAKVFFPPFKQSIYADVVEMRRELSAASRGLSVEVPDEAYMLEGIFKSDEQLRIIERAADKLRTNLVLTLGKAIKTDEARSVA